jgi:aryl-alcohol dehydrogenase-like predicted oxidoreductase
LKYRQLGASELQVPVISLGSWLTYSGGVEKRQALACVYKALDLGINFFDTANVYGRGAAESVLGEALAGIPRHSYILATKVFGAMSDTDQGLSRAQIVKQLDASLKRLGTDYVDLINATALMRKSPSRKRWRL